MFVRRRSQEEFENLKCIHRKVLVKLTFWYVQESEGSIHVEEWHTATPLPSSPPPRPRKSSFVLAIEKRYELVPVIK